MDEIEKLIRQLKYGNVSNQTNALKTLAKSKDERVVDALIEVLMKKSKYSPLAQIESSMRDPFGTTDSDKKLLVALTKSLIGMGTRIIPKLVEKYETMDHYAKVEARFIFKEILANCKTIYDVNNFEFGLMSGYNKFRKSNKDKNKQDDLKLQIAKLKMEIVKKKNDLSKDKGILLDDKPKPPKGNKMYQALNREQRTGNAQRSVRRATNG
jgi:hypothetical protein